MRNALHKYLRVGLAVPLCTIMQRFCSTKAVKDIPSYIPPQWVSRILSGTLTSGQHPPIIHRLLPYSSYPKQVSGPTVWRADDLKSHPEQWTHQWTRRELDEIKSAVSCFLGKKSSLVTISKETFQLPTVGKPLAKVKCELLHGKGFILFKVSPLFA
jgi:hypothetical protein